MLAASWENNQINILFFLIFSEATANKAVLEVTNLLESDCGEGSGTDFWNICEPCLSSKQSEDEMLSGAFIKWAVKNIMDNKELA